MPPDTTWSFRSSARRVVRVTAVDQTGTGSGRLKRGQTALSLPPLGWFLRGASIMLSEMVDGISAGTAGERPVVFLS
jgi:hypothetical protein